MKHSQIKEIITNRRTIKPEAFSGEQISDEDVMEILAAANWAPTHGYTEPWRFVVYSGEGLKTLGTFLADLDQPDKGAEDFNQIKYDRVKDRPSMASHIIGIGMKRGDNPKSLKLKK